MPERKRNEEVPPNQNNTGLTHKKDKNKMILTPYQGKRKTCGLFFCEDCNKGWFSPHSWANCYQKCKGCDAEIYPHKQFPHEKSAERKKNAKPHPQELCQKCKNIGYSCCGKWITEE